MSALDILREHDDQDLVGRLLVVAFTLADVYDNEGAAAFLKSPQKILGGRIPLELCKTEEGFAEVVDAVQSISDGTFV